MESDRVEPQTIRLPASLWKAIRDAAKRDKRTISKQVEFLIERGLSERSG